MKIIADSGSTKTDWKIVDNKTIYNLQTVGFSPYLQSGDEIYTILYSEFQKFEKTNSISLNNISQVYYYGTGCSTDEKQKIVKDALAKVFSQAQIEVEHDLLAAARALCGKNEGIAAILGTGSNSCYYDGFTIKENVDSVGYFLGDEGSGCDMGKKLIRAFIYKELPLELETDFINTYNVNKDEILNAVYHKPFPNRYLASFGLFFKKHEQHIYIRNIIINSFNEFFIHQVSRYSKHQMVPMHCTGSIGFYFQDILKEVAAQYKVQMGKNIKSPIDGLLEYHRLS